METKELIRTALEANDVEVLDSDTFRKYAEYIADIKKVKSVNGLSPDENGNIELSLYLTREEYNALKDKDDKIEYNIWQNE